MAIYVEEVSRTFGEYLLIPGLTTKQCVPSNVSLRTPLVKYNLGTQSAIELNIPFVSAIMQSVSGPELAIELARNGGLSFIFGSQPIANQAEMVRKVKKFKAGFVTSDSNLTPEHTLDDVLRLLAQTGHSTIGITHDGTPNGKLLGLVTSRDYRISRDARDKKIKDFMTPFEKLIVGEVGLTLSEANQIIWDHKLNTLPLYHNCLRYILICQNIIFFFIINHSKIMIKSPYQARVFIRQCTIKRLLIIKQCAILPILQQKHTRNTSHWIYLSTFSF